MKQRKCLFYSKFLKYDLFEAHLVCSFPLDSLPCEDAPLFFDGPDSVNSR